MDLPNREIVHKRTHLRFPENVLTFYFKRTCVLSETYLCFDSNALAFFLSLYSARHSYTNPQKHNSLENTY